MQRLYYRQMIMRGTRSLSQKITITLFFAGLDPEFSISYKLESNYFSMQFEGVLLCVCFTLHEVQLVEHDLTLDLSYR